MVGVLCDKWDLWLTWNNQTVVPLLSNPTMNSRQLRLIAMSWIVNNSLSTHYFVSSKSTDADVEMMETDKNVDYGSGGKVKPIGQYVTQILNKVNLQRKIGKRITTTTHNV